MLVDPAELQTHVMRGRIEQHIITWLAQKGYNKVNTPILTSGAGGAVAKPFETVAAEMSNTKLNLRIAPELWLKRLIVGGMDKVFELGPAFRNEGMFLTSARMRAELTGHQVSIAPTIPSSPCANSTLLSLLSKHS